VRRETVRILGVPVDNVSANDVLRFVAERIAARSPAQIATINAEYIMHALGNPAFMAVLRGAELRTPDGMGVVWAARRRGCPIAGRVGGSDLIWTVASQAAALGHRLFLLGGAAGVAERAAQVLVQHYPELTVAGTHSGSPRPEDDEGQKKLIRAARPDIVLVAFGAPQQDLWIGRMKEALNVPIVMGVGGAFDYVAGVAKRSPRWMQDAGLDWLYRLVRQPWRWRRMAVLPRFAVLAAVRRD
jgi:N-acetylglucosaminyldiphosphoundecaprenol N-acetyl-beta-D-mannosaminyltransferase